MYTLLKIMFHKLWIMNFFFLSKRYKHIVIKNTPRQTFIFSFIYLFILVTRDVCFVLYRSFQLRSQALGGLQRLAGAQTWWQCLPRGHYFPKHTDDRGSNGKTPPVIPFKAARTASASTLKFPVIPWSLHHLLLPIIHSSLHPHI